VEGNFLKKINMIEKRTKCKECGNTEYSKTLNESFDIVWECTECSSQTKVRKSKPPAKEEIFEEVSVTKKQKKELERLQEAILKADGKVLENAEYKTFKVDSARYSEMVVLETIVGTKGDEGTLQALERVKRLVYVGERGDLTLANAKDKNRDTGFRNVVHGDVFGN
jgi:ribosomal protein L37AE/L43A